MSFILDALKKAESERSRNSGPVLMDVRVAPPRRRLPTWAWVLGLVLLANLGVLAWLLLREPPATEAADAPAQATPSSATSAAPAIVAQAPATATPPPANAASLPEAAPTTTAPARGDPPPDVDSLPTAQELRAAGVSLPPLLLNLHFYDPQPMRRYVLLNGLRLTEGEFTPDGIEVQAITPGGAVLSANGRRFMLPAGG